MSVLLRSLATRAAPLLRGPAAPQRAFLHAKPAKDPVGPAQAAFAFAMFSLAILGPSGWILAHLEEYKKRD